MVEEIYPFVADTIVTLRIIEEGCSESYLQDFREETKLVMMAELMCRAGLITRLTMEMKRDE